LACDVSVYIGIAFTKIFGMRGIAIIFGDLTNTAFAKTPLF
jgi:hypothetical protein